MEKDHVMIYRVGNKSLKPSGRGVLTFRQWAMGLRKDVGRSGCYSNSVKPSTRLNIVL